MGPRRRLLPWLLASTYSQPLLDLAAPPAWSVPDETDVVRAAPLIDDAGNVYLSTVGGKVQKFGPDGKLLWLAFLEGAPCTGVLANGRLYLCTKYGNVQAFDTETGKKTWGSSYKTWGNTPPEQQRLFVEGDVLLTSASDRNLKAESSTHVVAYNTTDGRELWRLRPQALLAFFGACSLGDGSAVFQDRTAGLYRVSLRAGQLLWRSGKREPSFSESFTYGAPVCREDLIFATSRNSGDPGAETSGYLTAYAAENGNFLWEQWLPYSPQELGTGPSSEGGGRGMVAVGMGAPLGPPPTWYESQMGKYQGRFWKLALTYLPWLFVRKPRGLMAFDAETGRLLFRWDLGPTRRGSFPGEEERIMRRYDSIRLGISPHSDIFCMGHASTAPVIAEDGTIYQGWQERLLAVRDANGDGRIDPSSEVLSSPAFPDGFVGAPTLHRGLLAAAGCGGGLHAWKTAA